MGQATATFRSILPAGSGSPQRVDEKARKELKDAGLVTAGKFLENLSGTVNRLQTALQQSSPSLESINSIQNADISLSGAGGSISFTQNAIILTDAVLNEPNIVDAASFTSVGGTIPNRVVLSIVNGVINIAGTGTQAGHGNITIDGRMQSGNTVTGALTAAAITCASILASGIVQAAQILAGAFVALGVPGINATMTVRNATNTGTSTITSTAGIVTGFAP